MYGEYVTELTPSNFDDLVIKSTETWLVKFYAPWCGHCQQSAPAFSKAAKKLHGVARLGVVNCDEHKEIAQRFSIQGFPTIKVFKGEGKKARRPSDYNQARSSSAFVDHIKYIMPSFVARVKPSGVQAFFNDLPKLPHVLLFTDKKSTSPLYKGLSARFKGRLSFGEVRKSEAKHVPEQYSVNSFPTLLAFSAGESEPTSAHTFDGKMDPDSLLKFFEGVAGHQMNSTDGTGVSGEEKSSESERVFAQPKAYSGEVHTIVGRKQFEELCDARKDGRMCVLAVLKDGESHAVFKDIGDVAQKYQYDNMAFSVIDGNDNRAREYATAFGIPEAEDGVVVIRARKRKYTKLAGVVGSNEISAFLDRIVGGDAHWSKLKSELPEWETPEEMAQEKESESEVTVADEEPEQCGTEPPKDSGSCSAPKDDL
ncbi:protein disulfide-isomerase PDIA-2 Endoplasmic reticulum lumen [Gracilaria domingensis]|nr:protein disulfide-isomerase PDIA-2 Endoplasmic reticulum lumen [Gracilaria domingensis]